MYKNYVLIIMIESFFCCLKKNITQIKIWNKIYINADILSLHYINVFLSYLQKCCNHNNFSKFTSMIGKLICTYKQDSLCYSKPCI